MGGKELPTLIRNILRSVSLYPYIENRQFFKFTGFAVKTPLSVVYPTHTGG